MKQDKKDELIVRLYTALKTITQYETPDRLQRTSEKEWGLPWEEALSCSYENIQQTAKDAIKGIRLPRPKVQPCQK